MADSASIIAASQGTTAAASAAGGVAAAYGQIQAGRFDSKVDRFNARVSDMQAADAIARGARSVAKHRVETQRLKGAQRAALAAQGVVLDTGSAEDVIADTDTQAAEDEKTLKLNAQLEAWGYRVQAVDNRARARMATAAARGQAAGTLLTTVARFNDTAYRSGWFDAKPTAKAPPRSSAPPVTQSGTIY